MKKQKIYLGNRRKVFTQEEKQFVRKVIYTRPFTAAAPIDRRFGPNHHYCPPLDIQADMVELSIEERASLLEGIGVYAVGFVNWGDPGQVTDLRCALDNDRIPTHRDANVPLWKPKPLNLRNPLPKTTFLGIKDSSNIPDTRNWLAN